MQALSTIELGTGLMLLCNDLYSDVIEIRRIEFMGAGTNMQGVALAFSRQGKT